MNTGFFEEEIGWLTSIRFIVAEALSIAGGKLIARTVIGRLFEVFMGYIAFKLAMYVGGGLLASLAIGFVAFLLGVSLSWSVFEIVVAVALGLVAGVAVIVSGFADLYTGVFAFFALMLIGYFLSKKSQLLEPIIGFILLFTGTYFLTGEFLLSLGILLLALYTILSRAKGIENVDRCK